LDELLSALQEKNRASKPLLVKIASDLDNKEIESIVEIAMRRGFSGIIATNTTVSRDGLTTSALKFGAGGLSGAPLRAKSTKVIRTIYKLAARKLTIIGVGGIFSAEDAFEKIAAGASLVQAYTGFVYGGPGFPRRINAELAKLIMQRGFSSLDEAVGCGQN
jgi:dihydroorotate dehydrogenase